MQIPIQPAQKAIDNARWAILHSIAEQPDRPLKPLELVEAGDVDRCSTGHPLDIAIAALDELVAGGIIEQGAIPDTYIVVNRTPRRDH